MLTSIYLKVFTSCHRNPKHVNTCGCRPCSEHDVIIYVVVINEVFYRCNGVTLGIRLRFNLACDWLIRLFVLTNHTRDANVKRISRH